MRATETAHGSERATRERRVVSCFCLRGSNNVDAEMLLLPRSATYVASNIQQQMQTRSYGLQHTHTTGTQAHTRAQSPAHTSVADAVASCTTLHTVDCELAARLDVNRRTTTTTTTTTTAKANRNDGEVKRRVLRSLRDSRAI